MIQQSQNSIKGIKPYKVILVGGQAVGKSSLLHRLIESKFDPNYTSTIGVDFKTVISTVGGKNIVLQIWDTAGQQKFRALTQSYFRSAQGCICVYDINDKESLSKAEIYIKDAFQYKIKADCVYLLANKVDTCGDADGDKEGRELANRYEVNFLRVSAKTGEGLGDLVGNLAVKIDQNYGVGSHTEEEDDHHKRPRIRIDEHGNKKNCGC